MTEIAIPIDFVSARDQIKGARCTGPHDGYSTGEYLGGNCVDAAQGASFLANKEGIEYADALVKTADQILERGSKDLPCSVCILRRWVKNNGR